MQRRIIRSKPNGWEAVDAEGYEPNVPGNVSRHTLIGGRKDPGAPGPKLELRYFEMQPGAVTRLEKHEHEHYVIIKTGLGYAIVGNTVTEVGPNDVVYVGPLEGHQFVNRGDEPFGIYCIVEAARDFSQQLSEEELAALRASAAGAIARPDGAPRPRKERATQQSA